MQCANVILPQVRSRRSMLAIVGLALGSGGCEKKPPPPVTVVEGTLLLNDQPVPFALVEFYPELDSYGSEWNSSAVTDEKGYFKLTCLANGQPGAVATTHRVVINEAPPPKELRGMDGESQARLGEYMRKLANRPLPESYGNYARTPLRAEVKSGQTRYELHMKR